MIPQGVRLLHAGRVREALTSFDAVLAHDAEHAEALNNSAIALARIGNTEEAVHRFRRAELAAPRWAAVPHNLGMLLSQVGRHVEASAAYRRALQLDSSDASWWIDAGNSDLASIQPDAALSAYDEALVREPTNLVARSNRALALRLLMRSAEAEEACRDVIRIAPEYADAWSNLGMILNESNRSEEAAAALELAARLAPESVVVRANLCGVHLRAGRRDDAIILAQALVSKWPESAEAWNALSHAQLELGAYSEALASCERALALDPLDSNAAFNRATLLLLRGDYEEGLEAFEARRRISNQLVHGRTHCGPEWTGSTLCGETVLLTAEQGAGDIIQFVRYATHVKSRGAGRVLVESPPALCRLLSNAAGVDAVVSTTAPVPKCDFHVPLLSLPRLFATRPETIPASIPYLRVAARAVSERVRQGDGLRVGVAWSGNPAHPRDRLRSIHMDDMLKALRIEGVQLFSLQKRTVAETPAEPLDGRDIVDLDPFLNDFEDTAAAIDALDVVVSVDTSICHLAGALGKRTQVLLPRVVDWRWLLDRHDSPWYPTMRLFRQTSFDDWTEPLAQVRAELASIVDGREAPLSGGTSSPPRRVRRTDEVLNAKMHERRLFETAVREQSAGNANAALAAYQTVLSVSPSHAEALNNSGVLLAQAGQTEEAERRIKSAINHAPQYAHAHHNYALMLDKRGAGREALDAYERATDLESSQAQWWIEYAICASKERRFDVALRAFDQALALTPANAGLYADRAIALRGLFRLDDAIASCRESLRLDSGNPAAHSNLGVFLKEARRWEEGEQVLLTGLAAFPNNAMLLTNLSVLYLEWGRVEQALLVADQAVVAHPERPEGYNGRGCALIEAGAFAEAREQFARALVLDASNGNAVWNLAFLDLLDGNLADGLRAYEQRRTLNSLLFPTRALPGVEWDGGPLAGRSVLVHEEQGIGDVIQFARYASELKARGAGRVIIETGADAADIIRTIPGVDEIAVRDLPLPTFDVFVPLMSLPYRCGTTLDTIPANVPYLTAVNRPVAGTVRDAAGRLKVGLVWGGNPKNQRDRFRSVPFPALLSAVQMEGVTLFSLQKGPHAQALQPFGDLFGIVDLDPQLHTLEDTGAAIRELDLVVTICTSVAHLAGALGKPTWTLLANVADWRWFRDRGDSPWYPTMRLFRQSSPGDWARPLGEVRAALAALLARTPNAPQ